MKPIKVLCIFPYHKQDTMLKPNCSHSGGSYYKWDQLNQRWYGSYDIRDTPVNTGVQFLGECFGELNGESFDEGVCGDIKKDAGGDKNKNADREENKNKKKDANGEKNKNGVGEKNLKKWRPLGGKWEFS